MVIRKLTKTSLDLIKQFEGLRLQPYYDLAYVLTIGYGHTNRIGTFKFDTTTSITETEALDILERDLAYAIKTVSNTITVCLNDNQFGALVSLVHNIGKGNFTSSTGVRRLNSGDYLGAAEAFTRFNKVRVNGELVVSKGLVNRRNKERDVFLKNSDVISTAAEVLHASTISQDKVTGGVQKPMIKSKTFTLSTIGIMAMSAVEYFRGVQDLFFGPLLPYIPYAIIIIFAGLMLNRWLEAKKGEH